MGLRPSVDMAAAPPPPFPSSWVPHPLSGAQWEGFRPCLPDLALLSPRDLPDVPSAPWPRRLHLTEMPPSVVGQTR